MKKSNRFSRRALLQGLGGAALAPFVPLGVTNAETTAAPKRLVTFWTPNGLLYPEFRPKGGETDFTLGKILSPLAKYRDDLIVVNNLKFAAFEKYPVENDHDPAYMGFTGAPLVQTDSGKLADGASVDQVVAQKLARAGSYDGLVVGVEAYAPLFYKRARERVEPLRGPGNIFRTLFSATMVESGKDWTALDRQSVIDLVRPELTALGKLVGSESKRKLDAHLEHLRTLEQRIASRPSTATCAPGAPPPDDPDEVADHGRFTLDVMALALKCDLSRVASFMWFGPGGAANFSYDWLGAEGRHHDLSHAGALTPDRGEYDSLTKIGAFYAQLLGGLLDQLAAVTEGDRTMLDNSVVVWATEHPGNHPMYGDHGRTDVPYVLIGSGGGFFKTGKNLDTKGASNNQLLLSLVHAMGFTGETTFGERDLCPGPLPGLT